MKRFLTILILGVCSLSASGQNVIAHDFIVPPEQEKKPGTVQMDFVHFQGTYQELFSASLFASVPAGGGWIREIDFRSVPGTPSAVGDVTGISIDLSMTTRDVGGLSPVFAENLGLNNQLFYSASRSTTFASSAGGGGVPSRLSPNFVATGKGFWFDPAQGNLLLTMKGFHITAHPNGVYFFDGVHGDSRTAVMISGQAGALSGQLSLDSLVTGITVINDVPEPSTGWILGLGLAAGACVFRGRKLSKESSH